MRNKLLIGLIAGATIGSAAVIPGIANHHNKVTVTNRVLLASNNNLTNTRTNEAVVIGANNNINLYGMSTGTGIVSNLSIGQMLTILGENQGDYCKVIVQETGAEGYIKIDNMKNIINGTNDNLKELSENGSVINVSSRLRMRSNPSINGTIDGYLKNGTVVKILGKQGEWYKIEFNGKTSFVYEGYISINGNNILNQNSNDKGNNGDSGNNLNNNNSNTNNSNNSSNNNSNNSNNNNGNNNNGNNNNNENILSGDSAYLKAAQEVNIYKENNCETVIKTLKNQQENILILSFDGNNYKVKLQDGTIGYVKPTYLVFDGQGPKSDYLNKLNNITIEIDNSSAFTDPNATQAEMNGSSAEGAKKWNEQLTEMYNYLENNLPTNKVTALKESQNKFIANRETEVKKVGDKYEGGSIAPLMKNGRYMSLTAERCYNLVNQYPEIYGGSSTTK